MNFNRWIGTSLMLASLVGSRQILSRRRQHDATNRSVWLAVDYDDCLEISTRSGIDLGDLLHDLWHRGASHIGITEATLGDLMDAGKIRLTPAPMPDGPPGLTYLTAPDHHLLEHVATALVVRMPHLAHLAVKTTGDRDYLGIPGSLRPLRDVTAGFEPAAFQLAQAAGLVPVARPRHYPWPNPAAIDSVLAQAAALGSPFVCFADNYVLGHEMLMQATIKALHDHQLIPVYFAESRHQKGDWFIAKASLPGVVLGHEFAPDELDLEDEHGMAHKWGRMADRGIRYFSVRTMRGVHATDPLSLLDYVSMILGELVTARGLQLADRPDFVPHHDDHNHAHAHAHQHTHHAETHAHHAPAHHHTHPHDTEDHPPHAHDGLQTPNQVHSHDHGQHHNHDHAHEPAHAAAASNVAANTPTTSQPRRAPAMQWLGLAAAGAGGIAAAETLGLPEPWASLLTLALAGGAWVAVPLVDQPRSQLEEDFPPSYAPKAIGLGLTMAAPVAGLAAAGLLRAGQRGPSLVPGLLLTAVVNGAAVAALAATTADEPYMKRVEEFRSYNLDWAMPLGLVAGHIVGAATRPGSERVTALTGAAVAGLGAWLLSSSGRLPSDLLGPWTNRPLQGHTHHLSSFQARLGDLRLAASPQPLAKWGWLLPLGATLATTQGRTRAVGLAVATVGSIALLAPFRQGTPALDDRFDAAAQGLTAGLLHRVRLAPGSSTSSGMS